MQSTRPRLLGFTAALAFAMACNANPVAPSDIIGDTWRLVSLVETGTPPTTIDDPSKYTIQFMEDEQIGVKSDCNSCGGGYTLSGSSITIGPVACTRVFCGDTSRDAAFTRSLDKSRTVSVDGNELTLLGDGVRLTFVRD
jgi:heat shock protein HslJ